MDIASDINVGPSSLPIAHAPRHAMQTTISVSLAASAFASSAAPASSIWRPRRSSCAEPSGASDVEGGGSPSSVPLAAPPHSAAPARSQCAGKRSYVATWPSCRSRCLRTPPHGARAAVAQQRQPEKPSRRQQLPAHTASRPRWLCPLATQPRRRRPRPVVRLRAPVGARRRPRRPRPRSARCARSVRRQRPRAGVPCVRQHTARPSKWRDSQWQTNLQVSALASVASRALMAARMMLEEPVSYTLCSKALPRLPEPPLLPLQRAHDVDLEKAFGFASRDAIARPFRTRCACFAVHGDINALDTTRPRRHCAARTQTRWQAPRWHERWRLRLANGQCRAGRAAPRERARCGKLVKRARSWRGYVVPLPARQPNCQAF